MLNNEAQAASGNLLLNSASYASTAAASGNWIDVRYIEGDILFVQNVGGLIGTVVGRIEDAQSATGASAASTSLNEGDFLTVAATGNVQTRTVSANSIGGWVRYRGVITTGPAFLGVAAMGRPKNL